MKAAAGGTAPAMGFGSPLSDCISCTLYVIRRLVDLSALRRDTGTLGDLRLGTFGFVSSRINAI